jgi:hypothetical protein
MLGWVIGPTEDTRTLFRLTALKRLGTLDLQSPKVQHTIKTHGRAAYRHRPHLGDSRDADPEPRRQGPPGAVDYFEHMPIGWRRDAMKA